MDNKVSVWEKISLIHYFENKIENTYYYTKNLAYLQ